MESETREKEGLLCHSSLKSFTNTARGQRRPTSLFPNRQSTVPLPFFANSSTCHNVSGHRPLDWSETETERRFAFQPEPPPTDSRAHTWYVLREPAGTRGKREPAPGGLPGAGFAVQRLLCPAHHSTSCVSSGFRSRLPQQQGAHYDIGREISDRVWLTHQKMGVFGRQGHLSGRKHSQSPGWPGTSQEVLPSLPFTPERVLAWTRHVATLQSGGWEGPAVPGQVSF